MSRCLLLLAAGLIVGGCSRDAPLGPESMEPALVDAAGAEAGTVPDDPRDEASDEVGTLAAATDGAALDDALTRLLPALGEWGVPLRGPLLRFRANRQDPHALSGLQRALDVAAIRIPPEHRQDLDALLLALEITRH